MQPIEFFTQLKQTLKDLQWPSTTNDVFGRSVRVVPQIPMKSSSQWPFPACFITDDGARVHPQNNQLIEQQFSIFIYNDHRNDNMGEAVILGGNRASGDTTSAGQGLLDFEEVVIDSLIARTAINGKKINLVSKSKIKTRPASGQDPFAFRQLTFTTLLSYGDNTEREEIQRGRGTLFVNPTDIAGGSFGTELGITENGFIFDPGFTMDLLFTEDSGQTPTDVMYLGNACLGMGEFKRYNSSVLSVIFNGMNSGTLATIPGNIKSGKFFSNDASRRFSLLYVPEDQSKNMAILMYRAVPYLSNSTRWAQGIDTNFRCSFLGVKDGGGRVAAIGPLTSLPTP